MFFARLGKISNLSWLVGGIFRPYLWHAMPGYGEGLAAILRGKVEKLRDLWKTKAITRSQDQS